MIKTLLEYSLNNFTISILAMDFYYFDQPSRYNEKYALLARVVHKIIALADELIEQNCFLTKYVQGLEDQRLSLTNEMPTRDMMSVLFQNFRGQRHATNDMEKMEFLMEAINNLSKLADLFVARNCYLIKCIYAHYGEDYFDHSGEGIH